MDKRLIFLLGGARSGKSRYAENWAAEHGQRVLFAATAQAFDDEMRERIARHRAERPAHWHTVEAPLNIGEAIVQAFDQQTYDTVVLDCITLLASNALLTLDEHVTQDEANSVIMAEVDGLLRAYEQVGGTWLVISNEVGMGIVPPTRLGRLYRDALGRANQEIAQAADEVLLLVAGLPWVMKPKT
jgi:adenosylcobinamide kinase / adenosylcobinamide-phosphate guanylyltransferase